MQLAAVAVAAHGCGAIAVHGAKLGTATHGAYAIATITVLGAHRSGPKPRLIELAARDHRASTHVGGVIEGAGLPRCAVELTLACIAHLGYDDFALPIAGAEVPIATLEGVATAVGADLLEALQRALAVR